VNCSRLLLRSSRAGERQTKHSGDPETSTLFHRPNASLRLELP
jgi:hypothetical protein